MTAVFQVGTEYLCIESDCRNATVVPVDDVLGDDQYVRTMPRSAFGRWMGELDAEKTTAKAAATADDRTGVQHDSNPDTPALNMVEARRIGHGETLTCGFSDSVSTSCQTRLHPVSNADQTVDLQMPTQRKPRQ